MQNVLQGSTTDSPKIEKVNVEHDVGYSPYPPNSTNSNPAKSETETYSQHFRFMTDSSKSEKHSVSEEFKEATKFFLSPEKARFVDPETQARFIALLPQIPVLQTGGIGQLSNTAKYRADPEVVGLLTSRVSCALDAAAAALTKKRTDNPRIQPEKTSLVKACTDGDVGTVRKLLAEGGSVHETSEEGDSLLSIACHAGYFELVQVLLANQANREDRGINGECTPLMVAASAGHLNIVKLLAVFGTDVNAQSASGNTPLMYGCAGGHSEVVKFLLKCGANVKYRNENGHTALMEAESAGHVELAKILQSYGVGINTHSTTDSPKIEKVNVEHDTRNSSVTPHSTNLSPAKSATKTYSEHCRDMTVLSENEEHSVSEEFEKYPQGKAPKFLLNPEEDKSVNPETQTLEALLQASSDPEVLRLLTLSVSCALEEAAEALTRRRTYNPRIQPGRKSWDK